MSISIAVAGTTQRTVQCAQAFLSGKKFVIDWVVTPVPKPVGRKKIVTPTPVEVFAQENNIPIIHVEKKVTTQTQKDLQKYTKPDILLVVDFGYIVPEWLLKLPKIAPVNIHPSKLPKWRGSSPGQFAILYNEAQTAVTVMVMDNQLDHGPIITQKEFVIQNNWTQSDYYQYAFDLICEDLDTTIYTFVDAYKKNQNLDNITIAQPDKSPSPIARQIKKSDAFVPWEVISAAQTGNIPSDLENKLPKLLFDAVTHNKSLSLTLERASKAFSPWPQLWTKVQTKSGETRMKLLDLTINTNPNFSNSNSESDPHLLEIETVHLAGKQPAPWGQVKTGVAIS